MPSVPSVLFLGDPSSWPGSVGTWTKGIILPLAFLKIKIVLKKIFEKNAIQEYNFFVNLLFNQKMQLEELFGI